MSLLRRMVISFWAKPLTAEVPEFFAAVAEVTLRAPELTLSALCGYQA